MKALKHKIAQNFIISFLGRFSAGAIGIVSFSLTARTIGAAGFGQYATVLAFLYVFQVLADFGLDSILTREISKPGADEKKIISSVFMTRGVLLACALGLSFFIIQFTPYPPEVKNGVFVAAAGFFLLSLSGVLMGVFQKHLKTIIPAVADITTRVTQLAAVGYLYATHGSVTAFLSVFVLGAVVNFSIIFYQVRKETGFRLVFDGKEIGAMLRESWPLAVSTIMILVYFKGDTLILSFMHSARDVGIYSVAYKILENIIFFPAMFVGLVMPLLSKYYISDKELFRTVFQKTFDFLAVIAIPLVFGGIYCAQDIIRIISGRGFDAATAPLQILLVAVMFIFAGSLFGSAIIAIGKQKTVMYAYGSAAVINVAANLYFISRFSYIGAALVTAATELFVSLCMLVIIYKTVAFLPRLTVLAKAFAASLAMSAVLWLPPSQNIVVLVALGAAAYFTVMYALKGIVKEDFTLFINAAKNRF